MVHCLVCSSFSTHLRFRSIPFTWFKVGYPTHDGNFFHEGWSALFECSFCARSQSLNTCKLNSSVSLPSVCRLCSLLYVPCVYIKIQTFFLEDHLDFGLTLHKNTLGIFLVIFWYNLSSLWKTARFSLGIFIVYYSSVEEE